MLCVDGVVKRAREGRSLVGRKEAVWMLWVLSGIWIKAVR